MNTGFWGWLAGYKKKGNCSRKRGGTREIETQKKAKKRGTTAGGRKTEKQERTRERVEFLCELEREKGGRQPRARGGENHFEKEKTEGRSADEKKARALREG